MIFFTSSLIRQLHHFTTDFDRVLLNWGALTLRTVLFKYRVSYIQELACTTEF